MWCCDFAMQAHILGGIPRSLAESSWYFLHFAKILTNDSVVSSIDVECCLQYGISFVRSCRTMHPAAALFIAPGPDGHTVQSARPLRNLSFPPADLTCLAKTSSVRVQPPTESYLRRMVVCGWGSTSMLVWFGLEFWTWMLLECCHLEWIDPKIILSIKIWFWCILDECLLIGQNPDYRREAFRMYLGTGHSQP